MIAKKYRLKEREVKKVLQKGKPFFSSRLVFNRLPNTLSSSRYAIVISGKSVPSAVVRNIYRRMFYQICALHIDAALGDIVCVIKAKAQLTKDIHTQESISQEIQTIFKNIIGKNT